MRRAAELKGEPAPVDEILELDRLWREHLAAAEAARHQQNQLSKKYAASRDATDLRNAKEIGELLNVSTKTVLRDWQFAKAWLSRQLAREELYG